MGMGTGVAWAVACCGRAWGRQPHTHIRAHVIINSSHSPHSAGGGRAGRGRPNGGGHLPLTLAPPWRETGRRHSTRIILLVAHAQALVARTHTHTHHVEPASARRRRRARRAAAASQPGSCNVLLGGQAGQGRPIQPPTSRARHPLCCSPCRGHGPAGVQRGRRRPHGRGGPRRGHVGAACRHGAPRAALPGGPHLARRPQRLHPGCAGAGPWGRGGEGIMWARGWWTGPGGTVYSTAGALLLLLWERALA